MTLVRLAALVLLLAVSGAARAQTVPPAAIGTVTNPTPVISVPNPPNTPAQQAKHYVVLVSLDGFRYDYGKKFGTPHLDALAHAGVTAPDGMLPSFPSLTFPNHYSIVTGLYPEHHGIVGNSFYDPARDAVYVFTRPETNSDGTWYGGTPLWSLAEQQGMRSACFFWPGSEAEIAGKRPSYYLRYNDGLDDQLRIDQVIDWLNLPATDRPHFITLYFANVDHAGHAHGPDSEETRDAVHHVDDLMGALETRLRATGLPVDLIVLADHGMVTLEPPAVILSDFANLDGVRTQGSLIYAKDDAEAERIYQEFLAHPSPKFKVYRRANAPATLDFNSNPREGDPVVIPTGPYLLLAHGSKLPEPTQIHGSHGFDPHTMPEMKAIFFAEGPDFNHNKRLKPFANVDVYDLIAQILATAYAAKRWRTQAGRRRPHPQGKKAAAKLARGREAASAHLPLAICNRLSTLVKRDRSAQPRL